MLYTIFYGIVGSFLAYIIARIFGLDMSSRIIPGAGVILTIVGGLVGAGFGAGFGIMHIQNGTHIVMRLFR